MRANLFPYVHTSLLLRVATAYGTDYTHSSDHLETPFDRRVTVNTANFTEPSARRDICNATPCHHLLAFVLTTRVVAFAFPLHSQLVSVSVNV